MVFLALLLDFGSLLTQTLRFHAGRFHLLTLLLQLGQHILKVFVTLAYQVVCFLQNVLRQAQLPGNGEGVGLARNANEQLISGLEGLYVELAGGIDDALGSHGIQLQLSIVCRGNDPAVHLPAELNNGHGQCSTLCRVRTGTQLIKQDQGVSVTLRHHIYDGSHVAGEGGQALGNGLLITNICQDRIKGGERTAVSGRNVQTALCHQGQKSHRFQGHGFAAGVGACNNHGIKITAQADGDRYHLLGVDERMPRLPQIHPALIVHQRSPGLHPVSKLGFGKDHIQLYQHGMVQIDILSMGSSLSRQLCQDPLDLLFLLDLQLPQGVIGIDRRHGFHKEGGATGGNIVDKTGNIIFTFGFYRNHIPSLTDGDDRLPQKFAVGR